jgi:hypothetical protein
VIVRRWAASLAIMKVRSLEEFVATVAALTSGAYPIWFRGVRRHKYQLVPSLYRLGDPSWTNNDYLDLEERLVERFEQRSMPYRTQEAPRTQLGYLFEMQHYGAPTRLLDWSENAFMALWFALEMPSHFRTRVWVLDPAKWNSCLYPLKGDMAKILSPNHPIVKGWLPWEELKAANLSEYPVCIYGMHNSPRIVGQRGVFTLSGTQRISMEQQAALVAATGGAASSELLVAIDIPAPSQAGVRHELARAGFSRSMIYPDLVGLAQELTEKARGGTL